MNCTSLGHAGPRVHDHRRYWQSDLDRQCTRFYSGAESFFIFVLSLLSLRNWREARKETPKGGLKPEPRGSDVDFTIFRAARLQEPAGSGNVSALSHASSLTRGHQSAHLGQTKA